MYSTVTIVIPDCFQQIDIAIILDVSVMSLSDDAEFIALQNFTKSLVESWKPSADGAHVALITFAANAYVQRYFSETQTAQAVNKLIGQYVCIY